MSRGLNLIDSLKKQLNNDVIIYVVAMDEMSERFFRDTGIDCVKLVTISELISAYPTLKEIRESRTHREFCWTISSFSIEYVLLYKNQKSCIYVDSDIYFYSSPQILIDEMPSESSVLITEHNYSPQYDYTSVSGKYCVQFMLFKNNDDGLKVLDHWRRQCEEWCFFRLEDRKLGDQMYLDDWESRYSGIVYNCRDIGCGVAPWNLQKYWVEKENKHYYVIDKITKVKRPLVFFHFHNLMKLQNDIWRINSYRTEQDFKEIIYREYIKKLLVTEETMPQEFTSKIANADTIELLRFMPIPYMGDSHIKEYCFSQDAEVNRIRICIGNEELQISYKVSLYEGKWIIIEEVSNKVVFGDNIHEILWLIQREECFSSQASWNQNIHELIDGIITKRRIMTECPIKLFEVDRLDHPYYVKVKVTRIYDDVISSEGCNVYRDLLNPDSQNIIL